MALQIVCAGHLLRKSRRLRAADAYRMMQDYLWRRISFDIRQTQKVDRDDCNERNDWPERPIRNGAISRLHHPS